VTSRGAGLAPFASAGTARPKAINQIAANHAARDLRMKRLLHQTMAADHLDRFEGYSFCAGTPGTKLPLVGHQFRVWFQSA
jgi:hypothetical protein